jgi:hypothetical protein
VPNSSDYIWADCPASGYANLAASSMGIRGDSVFSCQGSAGVSGYLIRSNQSTKSGNTRVGGVAMRSLRILVACMAVIGVMSIVASSASAENYVQLPGCASTCENITVQTPGVLTLLTEGEETSCVWTLYLNVDGAGNTALTSAKVSPGEPLCEVFEIFEETLPWIGKICYDSASGKYFDHIEDIAFYFWIGAGTFEGPVTLELTHSGSPSTLTGAHANNSEIGTSGGLLRGDFEFSEGLEIEPTAESGC